MFVWKVENNLKSCPILIKDIKVTRFLNGQNHLRTHLRWLAQIQFVDLGPNILFIKLAILYFLIFDI